MSLYIRLFHGRAKLDEQLEGWGADGPVFGPFDSICETYRSGLRMFNGDEFVELRRVGDLVYYNEMYYGDIHVASAKKEFAGMEFWEFEEHEAVPPPEALEAVAPYVPPALRADSDKEEATEYTSPQPDTDSEESDCTDSCCNEDHEDNKK